MQNVLPQMTLGLTLKDEATFENFYPGQNKEIIAGLKKAVSGEGEKIIYLCGKTGQGCSHLLQACCHYAYQLKRRSIYLPLSNLITYTPDLLDGFETLELICIDDLHLLAHRSNWQEAIFHLYNRIYANDGRIIVTAKDLPKAIELGLPDLVSRLSWGIIYQLYSLSDEEKLSVLIMRASRRGITLSEEVGRFILNHCPRHMGTLFTALDALDKASLAAQRRLTIPFVKTVLEI